jgi:signal transduction histidine kinase
MAIIPREDWEVVRDRVENVVDQVYELALLHQQDMIRERVREVVARHQERFLASVAPLRAVIENNAHLSDLLYHDLLGYFSLISLLIPRLQLQEQDSILAMRGRAQVMRHIVEALRFYVPGEQMKAEQTLLLAWLRIYKNFFDETFKSYDHETKGQSPMLWLDIPPKKDWYIMMNRSIILLLLINLFQNAKEHGGAKKILLSIYESDERVFLDVKDDGKGIDDETAQKLFMRSPDNGGSGLGLWKSKERMAVMNGTITCYPRGGIRGGAKFTLAFKKAL